MTQKTIYLHIGRHKTGTSSIQHFVNSNADVLEELNLCYPESGKSGIAHHRLAQLFSGQNNKTPEARLETLQSPVLAKLIDEVDNQTRDVLISSESFQNAHVPVIKQAFGNYDLRILVYIRNQIDYLASSYAQKVWATNYCESMEHYYENVFGGDYLGFLNRWDDASDGAMVVRKFARESLCDQDIVADFFVNMLDIDDAVIKERILQRDVADANPSLTADLLAYKLLYNKSGTTNDESTERLVRQALANLSLKKETGPVRVTQQLKEACLHTCNPINQSVSEKYFDGGELFSMDRPVGVPSVLTSEDLIDISEKLIASDSRISGSILGFTEALQPILKAG